MPTLTPQPRTVAEAKLQALLVASSPSAIAKQAGTDHKTLRLLAAGLSRPTARMIDKCRALGLEPADWFAEATETAGA